MEALEAVNALAPAHGDLSARTEGRRRKAPKEGNPRGTVWALAVYGDLTGSGLGRRCAGWGSWRRSMIAVPRLSSRRCRGTDSGLIEGVSGGFGDGGATAVQCRTRGSPVGRSCEEAVTGVMALGF
jgi:hypothetical protein